MVDVVVRTVAERGLTKWIGIDGQRLGWQWFVISVDGGGFGKIGVD